MAEIHRLSRACLTARLLVACPCVISSIAYPLASRRPAVPLLKPRVFVPIYCFGSEAPPRRRTHREVDVASNHWHRCGSSPLLGGATQLAGNK